MFKQLLLLLLTIKQDKYLTTSVVVLQPCGTAGVDSERVLIKYQVQSITRSLLHLRKKSNGIKGVRQL